LSIFPHQEARFLLPAVPLFLSSVKIPAKYLRLFLIIWIGFNTFLALLMGVFHQGGVVPAQAFVETQSYLTAAYWWKTYSPPTWLLGKRNEDMSTIDLMGLDAKLLVDHLCLKSSNVLRAQQSVLVAPRSATYLDRFAPDLSDEKQVMRLRELWSTSMHLNLDDMDFGDDGVLPTLRRVFGRRGLVVWAVECRTVEVSPE